MKSFIMKAWSVLAVSTIAVTGLQADYKSSGQVIVIPGSGNACDPCCCDKPEPCYGYAYNPPVFFEDCCGWSADVEFLYWKPCQDGISYGSIYSAEFSDYDKNGFSLAAGTLNGTQKYPKFEWDSGFRVGIGYRMPCDCWEVGLRFTHFRTENDTSIAGQFDDITNGQPPFRGTVFTPSYSTLFATNTPFDVEIWKTETKWRVHFNQLDLALSREYLVGRCVTLKPYAGLRSLFLEQKYEIARDGSGGGANDDLEDLKEFVKMSNQFKGVGLLAGLESSYGFGCGLAFYGNASGSLIYGEYEVNQRDEIIFQNVGTGNEIFKLNHNKKDCHTCLLAGADLAFGLRWRQAVNCDRNAFTLRLGWEHHVWFDYNQFRSLAIPTISNVLSNDPGGNLYFYGITFAASVEF